MQYSIGHELLKKKTCRLLLNTSIDLYSCIGGRGHWAEVDPARISKVRHSRSRFKTTKRLSIRLLHHERRDQQQCKKHNQRCWCICLYLWRLRRRSFTKSPKSRFNQQCSCWHQQFLRSGSNSILCNSTIFNQKSKGQSCSPCANHFQRFFRRRYLAPGTRNQRLSPQRIINRVAQTLSQTKQLLASFFQAHLQAWASEQWISSAAGLCSNREAAIWSVALNLITHIGHNFGLVHRFRIIPFFPFIFSTGKVEQPFLAKNSYI